MSTKLKICLVYPTDPLGMVPGGIDTVIRGILCNDVPDIELSIVGVTTDSTSRPTGRWLDCDLGGHSFRFFPVLRLKKADRQARVPLSLRFTIACLWHNLNIDADILEFHRVEPMIAFIRSNKPKVAIVHQNRQALRDPGASFRWRYAPLLYETMERILLTKTSSIFCVRQDVVEYYRSQPRLENCNVQFIPMWVDSSTFYPLSGLPRIRRRLALRKLFRFPENSRVLIFVGRLDSEKAPLTLLDAFHKCQTEYPDIRLIYVGTGLKEGELKNAIVNLNLTSKVALSGLKNSRQIAKYLQGSDLFVLSSIYEGLPIALLEALASGVPAVSTDVGEVKRVVHPGQTGELSEATDASAYSFSLEKCLSRLDQYASKNCVDAVADFSPQKVLGDLYCTYKIIVGRNGTDNKNR